MTHSQYAIHALDYLFEYPIFKANHFISSKNIPNPTAKRLLATLRDHKLLKTLHQVRGQRPAVYVFGELLNLTEEKDIF